MIVETDIILPLEYPGYVFGLDDVQEMINEGKEENSDHKNYGPICTKVDPLGISEGFYFTNPDSPKNPHPEYEPLGTEETSWNMKLELKPINQGNRNRTFPGSGPNRISSPRFSPRL